MPPKPGKRSGKRVKPTPADFGGLDPEFMMSILDKIPPNPQTGRVDLTDIMRHMSQNPSEMEGLVSQMDSLGVASDPNVDLTGYDFASLGYNIKSESFWVLQLESMGMVDATGQSISPDAAHYSAGTRPVFMIYCYDERGRYRITHESIDLPDSKIVLQSIRRAIVKPALPLKPGLPRLLLVSLRFKQHEAALKPFLDALPAPFHWRFETNEEAEGLAEGIHRKNERGVREGLESANRWKTIGNAAYGRKDRDKAVNAYTDASEDLLHVLSQKPDIDEEKKAKRLLAICRSNRAAARLIPGVGMGAEEALHDAQDAEKADPSYNKSYIRQASAYQVLGQSDEAQEAIARALRRSDLENDKGLVDRLIELLTDGKGLSDDEGTFKCWILDILINDKKTSGRVKGLKGEWKRRLDAQFAKWN
ncbi:hypothetical protein BDQ12DRAFT_696320 [Crucibulum laeve]|uniref:Uncharacterized protein n=1 Tax=Crucibulum laeve TaxID=68775 RepID=A0A5C3MBY7_9AGAR|nr:hypothetical protein BDQ12DRAFT_696320 [Crucibulum laeve]